MLNHMKKITMIAVLGAFVFVGVFSSALQAQAEPGEPIQGADVALEATAIEYGLIAALRTATDLGVSNGGTLPTSRWYFFKEWKRGFSMFFTFSAVAKAELQLKFTDEKAAEMVTVIVDYMNGLILPGATPNNEEGIKGAIKNYTQAQERLSARLANLEENSKNPNVAKLLELVSEKTANHLMLFNELSERRGYLDSDSDDDVLDLSARKYMRSAKSAEATCNVRAATPPEDDDCDGIDLALENAQNNLQDIIAVSVDKGPNAEQMAGDQIMCADEALSIAKFAILQQAGVAILSSRLAPDGTPKPDSAGEASKQVAQQALRLLGRLAPAGASEPDSMAMRFQCRSKQSEAKGNLKPVNPSPTGVGNTPEPDGTAASGFSGGAGTDLVDYSTRTGIAIPNFIRYQMRLSNDQLDRAEEAFKKGNYGDAFVFALSAEMGAVSASAALSRVNELERKIAPAPVTTEGQTLKTTPPTIPTPTTYTLMVNIVNTGKDRVTSVPAGIDCGTDCSERYVRGQVVTIKALPSSGAYFAGWSGGGCSGVGPTMKVTMDSNRTCSATFLLTPPPPVVCDRTMGPVCGSNGITYVSPCDAEDAKIAVKYAGKCQVTTAPIEDPMVCTAQYDPVCGIDGKTYGNSCEAGAASVVVKYKGECGVTIVPEDPMVCTAQYDPVCGIDGKTYGNSCTAGAASVVVKHAGKCQVTSAPTSLSATTGDGTVTIAFTAGSNGGASITNYEYQLDGEFWFPFYPTDVASPVTITRLTNGTVYSIKLRAVNSEGAGAESSAITARPATPATPAVSGPFSSTQIYKSWTDAVQLCLDKTNEGSSDWRLPTKDELLMSYATWNSFGFQEHTYYWSSTAESVSGMRWLVYAIGGNVYSGTDFGGSQKSVRCIH